MTDGDGSGATFGLPALAAVRRWAVGLGHGLLNVVYPPRCLGCGARPEAPALPLCPACLRRLERATPEDVAARLARLPEAEAALGMARALWTFDKAGALQRVQHALKYGNRPRYGVALGRLMARAWTGTSTGHAPAPEVAGVVPIPLHRTRRLERGYNQAEALAEGVADALDVPMRADVLARPAVTRSQTHLDRRRRWQNVSGAFAVTRPADAEGRAWLLIDDVLTTGSTAGAAAHALLAEGASAVHFLALALART
jgi:ComF family protein